MSSEVRGDGSGNRRGNEVSRNHGKAEAPDVSHYLGLIRRWRRLYFITLSASLLLGIALAFILPPRYRARAVLLPPRSEDVSLLESAERPPPGEGSLDPGPLDVIESPAGLAARLVTSVPVMEEALDRLEPSGGWPPAEEARARERLAGGLRAWVTDEMLIVIEGEAESSELAAALANAGAEALDHWTRRHEKARAREDRRRLEMRVDSLEETMTALADSLARFRRAEQRPGSGGDGSLHALASLPGDTGRIARRMTALGGSLTTMGIELARVRLREIDPPVVVECLERASPPLRPARPVRPAVVALLLVAGLLGSTVVAVISEAFSGRDGAGGDGGGG